RVPVAGLVQPGVVQAVGWMVAFMVRVPLCPGRWNLGSARTRPDPPSQWLGGRVSRGTLALLKVTAA
uniref:hypothetical protein n=2 Tax=Nocardia cyriacigeorgica TaxID=135487 RepID=UPI00245531EB